MAQSGLHRATLRLHRCFDPHLCLGPLLGLARGHHRQRIHRLLAVATPGAAENTGQVPQLKTCCGQDMAGLAVVVVLKGSNGRAV